MRRFFFRCVFKFIATRFLVLPRTICHFFLRLHFSIDPPPFCSQLAQLHATPPCSVLWYLFSRFHGLPKSDTRYYISGHDLITTLDDASVCLTPQGHLRVKGSSAPSAPA